MALGELLTRPDPAERAARLPGDEVVSPADVVMDRAFTLAAAPDAVWPWIVQLGKRRAGWYLPALVERLVPPAVAGCVGSTRGTKASPSVTSSRTGVARDATFTVLGLEPGRHLLYGSTRGRTRLTWSCC